MRELSACKALLECSGKLDYSVLAIRRACGAEFLKRYRRAVGRLLGLFYIELLRDLFQQYPELEPESMRSNTDSATSTRGADMDLDDSFAAASASVNQVQERLRGLREILLTSPGEVAASYAEAIDTSVGMAGELLQILAAQQARQSRHNRPTKTTIMATGSKSGTPGDMSAVYSYDYADRQATLGLQGNTRRTLEEALALSRRALYEDALTLLDKALVDARQAQDRRAVVVFARNAGIISSGEGDFQRAMAYYSEALENGPDDLYMYIALADSNQRLGNNEAALDLLSHCRQAALLQGDEDILAILRAQGI